MRVLAVGAHPDDLETLCGGTLARFVREGHEVVMCHAANGNKGSYVHTSQEIGLIRTGEAQRAAEICGATHINLGLSDGEVLASDRAQRSLFVDLIRDARPDVIITHSPADYHTDHNETSRLVFDTSFLATVPLVVTERPVHDKVTPIYYMDTVAGLGFVPTEFVDITEVMETKEAMLRAHESQLSWIKDHDDGDIVEQMKTVSAFRGQQCGVRYAEGFAACLAALRCTTHRLLP
ncbi:MAG: PIG-L family deacetylase [Acidimicrobiales bacterium]